MLKVNGYEGNYSQLFIYNENGEILFQTERPYNLNLDITTDIRNARKLDLSKQDCFEIKTSLRNSYSLGNGKDLYIPNYVINVVKVEEKPMKTAHGETNYKMVYTLKNYLNGTKIEAESDYYTRTEKTEDRLYCEKLAEIISECLRGKSVYYFEVEKMLEKLNITIKDI